MLGARLNLTMWSKNRETNLLFQTLLFDQSLPGAHQGGVDTCARVLVKFLGPDRQISRQTVTSK